VHNKADIVNTGDNNAPPPARTSHERNAAIEGESQLKYSSAKEGSKKGGKEGGREVRGSAQSKTELGAVGGYETRNPERRRRRRGVVTTVTTVRLGWTGGRDKSIYSTHAVA